MNKEIPQALITLQNSKESQIPAFAGETLQQTKGELKRLNDQIKKMTTKAKEQQSQKTIEEKAFEKAKIALLFDQVYRIKRFLLIYYNFRCDRIEDQFWFYGGDLNHTEKGNLSDPQKNYFNSYKSLVMDYIQDVKVDLLIDLDPPIEIEVEFRMLRDCGQILDQYGRIVKLQKNSCGFIKKRLIQPYVKQGFATIKKK